MLAHYRIDPLDPAVSLRRIHVLLRRLPPGAWPGQDSAMAWSYEAHLLAGVIDALAALTYVTLRAAGSKSASKPRPIRRPGGPLGHQTPPGSPSAASGQRTGSWGALAASLMGRKGVEVKQIGR